MSYMYVLQKLQVCFGVERRSDALQWQVWDTGEDRRVSVKQPLSLSHAQHVFMQAGLVRVLNQ